MKKNINRTIIFALCLTNTFIWTSSSKNASKKPLNFTSYQQINSNNQMTQEADEEHLLNYRTSQFMFLQHSATSRTLKNK